MNEHVVLRMPTSGYETDFVEWSTTQAALLRSGRIDDLDIENIAEEIESLGRSDRRGLESQMIRLIEHLLKLQFAVDQTPQAGWRKSVRDARRQIGIIVEESPSLRRQREQFYLNAWPHAVTDAAEALASNGDAVGAERVERLKIGGVAPLSVDQALDPDFLPAR